MKIRKIIAVIVVIALLFIIPVIPALASRTSANSYLHSEIQATQLDPNELKIFVDAYFTQAMEENGIPGAAIVIVQDGEVIYSGGYGFANLESQEPFSSTDTVVRAKSLSKLFTATAVMQLASQGKLDLHTDVNQYLVNFQLEKRFIGDVTLIDLLTHTSGYPDRDIGTMALTASELTPLGEYLAKRMPPQQYPPGDLISYSDHNISLAGYLVQEISGKPFDQYIQDHILQPLEMNHSSFYQPAPPAITQGLAAGYIWENDKFKVVTPGYWNVAPAVALVTTASDLSHFIIAQLNNGYYKDAQILEESALEEMHQQQFTQHPRISGLAVTFWEHLENGRRILMHAGEGAGFANVVVLIPSEGVGYAIVCNRDDFNLHVGFLTQFLDRYYPGASSNAAPEPMPGYLDRAKRYAGVYRFARHTTTTIDKLDVFGSGDQVWMNDDGTISSDLFAGHYIEIEPLLFQQVDGEGMLAFREDQNGHITHLFITDWPYEYQKLRWFETPAIQTGFLIFLLVMFISGTAAWLWRLYDERGKKKVENRLEHWSWLTGGGMCLLNLLFVFVLLITSSGGAEGDIGRTTYGMPAGLIALQVIPYITALLALVCLGFSILLWQRKSETLTSRFHYSLIALAGLLFIGFNLYWNILGFKF